MSGRGGWGKGGKGRGGGSGGKGVVFQQKFDPTGQSGKGRGGVLKGKTKGTGKGPGKGSGKIGKHTGKVADLANLLSLLIEKHNKFQSGLLDLSSMMKYDEIKNIQPATDLGAAVVAAVMKKKEAKSLSLENNKMTTLGNLARHIKEAVAEIDSLSLADNNISDIKEIQKLAPLRVKHIFLRGNPLYNATDKKNLFIAIRRALPTLVRVDDVEIDRSSALDTVPPIPGGLKDNIELHSAVKSFMADYYGASMECSGTTNIDKLLDLYAPNSVMSISRGGQQQLTFGSSILGNSFTKRIEVNARNVLRGPHHNCNVGKMAVGTCLQLLHSAKATYDQESISRNTDITQLSHFTAAPVVTVITRGSIEFVFEKGLRYKKYFDRTWVLVPSAPNSPPKIVNDMLHIRETKNEEDAIIQKGAGKQMYYGCHMLAQDCKVMNVCMVTGLPFHCVEKAMQMDRVLWDEEKCLAYIQDASRDGLIDPSLFSESNKDQKQLLLGRFVSLTNLTDTMAWNCISANGSPSDLLTAWLLFKAKRSSLDESCYRDGKM